MKLKDKTKELYEDIKLNDEQSNKILNKILNNQKRFKFKIIHLTPVLIVVAIFIAASFINIKNIEYVMATEKIISSSTMGVEIFERERKNHKGEPYKVQLAKIISIATNMDLNPNANLPVIKNSDFHSTKPDKHTQYKIKDLEKILNVDLLESEYLKNTISHSETKKSEGKITKVQFETEQHSEEHDPLADSYKYKDDVNLYHWIMIMGEGYGNERSSYTYTGAKVYEHYIENLDTLAVIIEDTSYTKHIEYTVRFDYKNVQYYYSFLMNKDINPQKELYNFLNSLK